MVGAMRVAVAVLLAALLAAPAARADVPAGNLVVNPGAEAGPGDPGSTAGATAPPGWTRGGEFTAVRYGAPNGFPTAADGAALGGGANFFAGGNVALSSGSQRIDVSSSASEIDAGVVTGTLSAYLGGFAGHGDAATVTATALDAGGNSLGSIAIGPVTRTDRNDTTMLLPRAASNPVPIGTRAITVRIDMTRTDPSYNDGYADNVSVTLASTTVSPQPSPIPSPAPSPAPAPVPVPGKSVVVARVSGKVLVKRPGAAGFVELDATQGIPLGSTVDTTQGVIQLTARPGETARFYDGIFKVTQSGKTTDLTLAEPLAPCARRPRAAAAKPKTRKLWGDGTGSFRTRGQYSSATVRGTRWLVQDSCAGTLTKVAQGVVSVRDAVKQRTVVVRAGKSYMARPRG
jgi:hypothetical protein